jgi:hypothetical protein
MFYSVKTAIMFFYYVLRVFGDEEGHLIHFVLPIKIGHVETRDFSADEVVRLLEE